MNEFIIGLFALGLVCFIAWPYYSLTNLKDIAVELNELRKELEKLNEGIRRRS